MLYSALERKRKQIVKLVNYQQIMLISLGLSISAFSYSQTPRAAHHQQAPDTTGIVAKTETSPRDDDVLELAPELLGLEFPQFVRLVKLTLRNEQRDWIEIGFRYNPRARESFEWELPALDTAIYYTAEWAVLAANEQLVRGSFSFSFGSDAELPSVIKKAEEAKLEARNSTPDGEGRYVTSPRTEIIINRDPPAYDPPFIIELEAESADDPC